MSELQVPWFQENLGGSLTESKSFSYLINGLRYYGTQKRSDYIGSVSSGGSSDFRYYNYRRVPYLGGSDHYSLLNKMVLEAQSLRCAQ